MSFSRKDEIDVAKGLAIVLVVLGHVVSSGGAFPKDNNWYLTFTYGIYSFHMPFFMFLSGLVAGLTFKWHGSLHEWARFAWQKMIRLMPAYLLFGAVVFFGKKMAADFVRVDNMPVTGLSGLMDIVLWPAQSAAGFLWFIYVLFFFYLTLHPVMRVFQKWPLGLLVLGLGLQFLEPPSFMMLDRYCGYFLYFYLGVLAGQNYDLFNASVQKWGKSGVVFFLLIITGVIFFQAPSLRMLSAILALPAIMYMAKSVAPGRVRQWLLLMGSMSFSIYLLNTISIGVIKGIGLKMISWDGLMFLPYFVVLTIGGLAVPMLVRKHIFERLAWLERITR